MTTKRLSIAALSAGFGLLGSVAGQWLINPQVVYAAYGRLTGDSLFIFQRNGNVGADIHAPAGSGGVFDLYGEDGKVRVQVGSYGSGGEKGQPLIGLWDNSNRLRMLFRLAGANESPVIIMKDNRGSDRLVMGLDLSGSEQNPFISTVDASGKKKNLVGRY